MNLSLILNILNFVLGGFATTLLAIRYPHECRVDRHIALYTKLLGNL